MKRWKLWLLVAVIISVAAAPGTAIEEEHETEDGCCMSCAHYIYTSPDGQSQERWDCMGFDCWRGYRDCWEHHDGSKPCVTMWSCTYF